MKPLQVIRRLHLYLGVFLLPWLVLYALGALVLNHRPLFAKILPSQEPGWTPLFEREYHRPMPADADPRTVAGEILADLDMNRSFWANRPNPRRLEIHAFTFLGATRITYHIEEGQLVAEKQRFAIDRFLVNFHERGGFGQPPWLTKAWGVIVDLVGLALVTWAVSGLVVWWKVRRQHMAGALVLLAGAATFIALIAIL